MALGDWFVVPTLEPVPKPQPNGVGCGSDCGVPC